jgi:hypothetical protein
MQIPIGRCLSKERQRPVPMKNVALQGHQDKSEHPEMQLNYLSQKEFCANYLLLICVNALFLYINPRSSLKEFP